MSKKHEGHNPVHDGYGFGNHRSPENAGRIAGPQPSKPSPFASRPPGVGHVRSDCQGGFMDGKRTTRSKGK